MNRSALTVLVLLWSCCVSSLVVTLAGEDTFIDEQFVARVNAKQGKTAWGKTWTSSLSSWTATLPREKAIALLGGNDPSTFEPLPEKQFAELATAPDAFDSRTNWPQCATMLQIRDQADCGSCWAFGAVESMSDRECIFNNINVTLSAEDMNSCSGAGSCNGGDPALAYKYWVETGVVTETCRPYSLAGCDHHIENSSNPCAEDLEPTPPCVESCVEGSGLVWAKDIYKGASSYSMRGEQQMMDEIAKNGPVEVTFMVFDDFLTYSGGIYYHVEGRYGGNHCVKVMGWGVENDVKYWIVANSWNEHWGEKGFFRILKGTNECGFESSVVAGIPASL
ncbi:C1 family cathepsin B33 [Pelomyxa schiedti]|nr:C1 family cathepsin B33 [Pelomyxa schiedti]